ncbi:hypothetical protein M5K25_028395 [Dendrobium thyrsiflorum]|uniref:Uncharacterized protein n=1 Tax=Dendrobium thyrsiflorum TaxID=117978 RepID=A0ABD0TTC7_DENTH
MELLTCECNCRTNQHEKTSAAHDLTVGRAQLTHDLKPSDLLPLPPALIYSNSRTQRALAAPTSYLKPTQTNPSSACTSAAGLHLLRPPSPPAKPTCPPPCPTPRSSVSAPPLCVTPDPAPSLYLLSYT